MQPAKLPASFGVHARFPVAITEAIVINKQGLEFEGEQEVVYRRFYKEGRKGKVF